MLGSLQTQDEDYEVFSLAKLLVWKQNQPNQPRRRSCHLVLLMLNILP